MFSLSFIPAACPNTKYRAMIRTLLKTSSRFHARGVSNWGRIAVKETLSASHYSFTPRNSLAVRSFSSLQAACSDTERELIHQHALQPQTSVSLQALMRTGRGEYLHKTFGDEKRDKYAATELVLIQVASFLRRELPIRLAHRIQDLESIPVLRDMTSVKEVRNLYIKSFLEIMAFDTKIQTADQEAEFADIVENIYERHSKVLVQMARGAYEFRHAVRQERGTQDFELEEETHEFLNRFYLCRIGIRVLIGQYLALRQPPVENYIGIICSKTSPYEIVKRAIGTKCFVVSNFGLACRKYID